MPYLEKNLLEEGLANMLKYVSLVLWCLAVSCGLVSGHGRLMDPPGRSTVWRYSDLPLIKPYVSIIEANYNDNQLFCGGANHQQALGGKCGVCGDAYDAADPENVPPGKYAKGIIVRQYPEGSTIAITIEITSHHQGYFEFRLCPWNDVFTPATHECLDQIPLTLLSKNGETVTQYDITGYEGIDGKYTISAKLPDGITCDQCVLQWKYHTGNSWGCDGENNCGVGVGQQEEFYGCADIAIGTDPVVPPPGFRDGDVTISTTTSAISSLSSTPTTSTTSTTTQSSTTTTSTTSTSSQNSICAGNENGYVKQDCHSYYRCVNGVPYPYDCPPGTAFDETTDRCDYESKVDCQ